MEFSKKKFSTLKAIVLSERPLYSMQFEERIASLIPAMEISVDSFEDYSSAYDHCARVRTVGLFFLHILEASILPENTIDELAAPFESIDSVAGLFVIAANEKVFTDAYVKYGGSERLLGMCLESDIESDSAFRKKIAEAVDKFEKHQVELAVPKVELEFFMKAARKFENLDLLHQITHVLTHKLDRDWYDNLLVEAGPTMLSLPENQKWILNNSPNFARIGERLVQFLDWPVSDLILSKDSSIIVRAVITAFKLYQSSKEGRIEDLLHECCQGTTAFSPTLKRILYAERANILSLDSQKWGRRLA